MTNYDKWKNISMGLFLLMLIDNAYYRAVDMQWLIAIGCG